MRQGDLHGGLDPLTRRRLESLAVVAIVAGAALLRLWDLGHQPGGLYPDEAAEALDAHRLLTEPGFHPVFFQDDAGREALYGYLVAIAFRVFGESVTVLRGTSAVIGVLAVVAVYAWLRRRGPAVALGAAGWTAGALWLVCISRDGMRNVLVPVTAAVALWAMTAWAEHPTARRAALAGAAMALGLWTYQPLKLLPILLVAWLIWTRTQDRRRWEALRPLLGWLALGYVVVGAPMIYTAVTDTGHYFGRAVAVTAGSAATGGTGILEHTARTLLMFAVTGDPNPRHDVGALPLLGWPMTALALLGAVAAWRKRAEPFQSLLLLALPVFLVPPLVATADAAPHFLRSLGLAAPLAALVGLGTAEALRLSRPWAPKFLSASIVTLLILGVGGASGAAYFDRPQADTFDAYSGNVVQLARLATTEDLNVVLVDDYRSTVVRFLDASAVAGRRTVIADPVPRPVPTPAQGQTCQVLALSRDDVARAYGTVYGYRTAPVAYGPDGRPSVWKTDC